MRDKHDRGLVILKRLDDRLGHHGLLVDAAEKRHRRGDQQRRQATVDGLARKGAHLSRHPRRSPAVASALR